MIIRLVNEKNLVKATEVKLIKTSDYQDTLTFKLPIDEEIAVDELIGVRTKVMKQDYRVKEIITKDKYRDVYCEHKFFDCKNIIIPYVDEANRGATSYNNFENYTNLQLIAGHLNRIMRTKGDTEYKFTTEVNKSGVIECDDTPLYDLIFGEKGILKTFNVELVYDNYRVKFVEKRPSKNTEILFHEKKNISELQATVDFKEIITKLHVTCKYTPETTEEQKEEKERARAAKRLETFNKSQERIRQREEKQAKERALKRKQEEEDYKANRKKPKRTKEQIHAEHVQRQQEREKQILANNETRRVERERKFNEREQQRATQRVTKKKEKEKLILKTVYVSPLVDQYARPYEASLSFDSKEINSEEALIAWCNANIFTEEDPRDVPLSNFSFKPTLDNYNVDINDRAMVNFESIDTNKVIHCCKIEYDALHDKYISIEFGELNKSTMKEAIGNLNAKISEANSNISRGFNMIDSEIEAYVQKELEAYNELFGIDKEELEDSINQGFEDAKIEAEKVYGTINTDIEEKLAPIREEARTTVEAYNQQFITTMQTLDRNKAEADRQIIELNKNKIETEKQFRELNQRITGMQDISSNSTVVELKKIVNEAKETGKNINQKVTELEGNVTREFSSVKAKNENDLKVIRGEIKTGVDGLTSKISSLEEYKNQDGSRTESLKQWVQRDTASQLNSTRQGIERWVDNKGYATTTVVENKVQETANSFSREISNVRNSIPTSLGGRNYITDSDKLNSKGFYGWNKWEKSVSEDTIILTKIEGSDTYGFYFNLTELVKTQFQNETLTWSLDIKASRNMTLRNVGFESNGMNQVNITTEWQRISHTFTNKFTKYFAFVFYNPTTNFNNGDKIYIRLPKLEKGNVATDWTPAPEDNNIFVKNTEFSNKFNENAQGINRQLTALEDYKNQDGSRTESLKQWVQRDTASQLSRERIEITRIVDNKGFVKNTEFSSKFNENAQGINRKLDALETYKNQDGTRTSALKQWTQENTANQLSTARRSIESWVDSKGYATTSVVENKVQETANSFSREISNVRNSIPTSVGGRNYILNSNFAKDLENWEMHRLNNSGLNWQKGHAITNFGRGLHIWGTPNDNGKGLGTVPFDLNIKRGEKLTLSIDLGKDTLTQHSILYLGLHFMDGNNILHQQWQQLDLATQNFEVRKYKRILRTFTSETDANKCRLMIHTKSNQLINFYIDNIKLEKGDIATDWTPAPEDMEQNVNELNSWKQTTTGTLNTVTNTLNDTVRHSQLQITADSINFGSNKVFNGQNLASMLSVSPDSIKAITDKLVITPANENLIKPEYRRNSSFTKDMQISEEFDIGKTKDFLVKGKARTNSYENRFRFAMRIIYKDGANDFITGIESATYINGGEFSIPFKINEREKEIKSAYFTIDRYGTPIFDELSIVPQKSAELIVDGTIEGKHIKSSTIETGHLKAGSVTANIIASDAIESKHLKVSDAMIDKIVGNQAFVSKLWAKEAFINNLNSVKIKATQIETNWLAAYTGFIGGFRIGHNPHDNSYWLTGSNNFECGINQGANVGTRGAQLWAAWGNNWLKAGPNAWLVNAKGVMTCNNRAVFNRGFDVHGAGIYTHDQDITSQGAGSSTTTVMWWSQINRVKSAISDQRLKTNIKPTKINALDTLNDIEIVEFNWKKDGKFEKIGAIAQQVQSIDKDLVVRDMDDKQTYNDYLRINYYDTIPYLIKAVQELSTENKELKQRIIKLEEKVNGKTNTTYRLNSTRIKSKNNRVS